MTKQIFIGKVPVGGGAPVTVQSMTNTDTKDTYKTIEQIKRLADAGCDIVRASVPDADAARAISAICAASPIPVVADIHFDHRIALMCLDGGISKIRINPGNIGAAENVRAVAEKAKRCRVPIRIGVNSGSIEKELGAPTPENMVKSAARHAALLEECGFYDIALSLKASDVKTTVAAYRLAAKTFDYPLHVGVTEAGTSYGGLVKSSAGIGALLIDGIGDTIRVSLTADPVEEVRAGRELLLSLGLSRGARLISCPTCARTKINLIDIANKVQARLTGIDKDITVAVMGCVVNGPGEASHADVGIAGGDGCGVVFCRGEIVKKVAENEIIDALFDEIDRL